MFYLELVTDMLHLFVYVIFFVIVFTNYGLPLHLVRPARRLAPAQCSTAAPSRAGPARTPARPRVFSSLKHVPGDRDRCFAK